MSTGLGPGEKMKGRDAGALGRVGGRELLPAGQALPICTGSSPIMRWSPVVHNGAQNVPQNDQTGYQREYMVISAQRALIRRAISPTTATYKMHSLDASDYLCYINGLFVMDHVLLCS